MSDCAATIKTTAGKLTCTLPKEHDGFLHEAADGNQWGDQAFSAEVQAAEAAE